MSQPRDADRAPLDTDTAPETARPADSPATTPLSAGGAISPPAHGAPHVASGLAPSPVQGLTPTADAARRAAGTPQPSVPQTPLGQGTGQGAGFGGRQSPGLDGGLTDDASGIDRSGSQYSTTAPSSGVGIGPTVEFTDLEESRVATHRILCQAALLMAVVAALLCWSPDVTPILAAAVTLLNAISAYRRMRSAAALLSGSFVLCRVLPCLERGPLATLRNIRVGLWVSFGCWLTAATTHVIWLAASGAIGSAVGVAGCFCLAVTVGLALVVGIFAYRFAAVLQIFEAVQGRELASGGGSYGPGADFRENPYAPAAVTYDAPPRPGELRAAGSRGALGASASMQSVNATPIAGRSFAAVGPGEPPGGDGRANFY